MRFFLAVLIPMLVLATSVAPASASEPLTYVAIGASDSVGVGADDPAHDGWVPRFANLLGSETRMVNLGVSGALLEDALRDQLPLAVQQEPDVVTVWLGVNDFNALVPLSVYSAQLDALLGTLRSRTSARIMVGNLPDLSQVSVYSEVLSFLGLNPAPVRNQVARWNAAIAQVSARHGATVVDLYAGWSELAQHPEYVSSDGFHPSSAGYGRIAELFYTNS
jgi:lysophospholipase L1-like esterase